MRIVEQRDASPEELAVTEMNTSIYAFRRDLLGPALRHLSPDNSQGEYYLTDVIGVLFDAGYSVTTLEAADPMEAAGVNDRAQLAIAEAELRDRTNERWMRRGSPCSIPNTSTLTHLCNSAPTSRCFPEQSSRAAP